MSRRTNGRVSMERLILIALEAAPGGLSEANVARLCGQPSAWSKHRSHREIGESALVHARRLERAGKIERRDGGGWRLAAREEAT